MSSVKSLDLNSDMGESFGRWKLGNDAELMAVITSANIACGWHGGDPKVMRETVQMAVERGVGIGAHVGLPDLLGFGRRRMAVTPDEIYDYTMYQAGALRAFAEKAQVPVYLPPAPSEVTYPPGVAAPPTPRAVVETPSAPSFSQSRA